MAKKGLNSRKTGRHYENKTAVLLQEKGYETQVVSCSAKFQKTDVLGADVIAISDKGILFVQVKAYTTKDSKYVGKSKAKKKFNSLPFPDCVRRIIYLWDAEEDKLDEVVEL